MPPLLASALVLGMYAGVLTGEKLHTYGPSSLFIDGEHSRAVKFDAAVTGYAFAAAVLMISIWAGAGVRELIAWRRGGSPQSRFDPTPTNAQRSA